MSLKKSEIDQILEDFKRRLEDGSIQRIEEFLEGRRGFWVSSG